MTPIIERLRSGFGGIVPPLCDEAANVIEHLQQENERLKKDNNWLRAEIECPDCKCATPQDADAKECGCDSIVCTRAGTLVEMVDKLQQENERLKGKGWKK